MAFKFNKRKVYKNYNGDWESKIQIIVADNGVFRKTKTNSICFITRKVNPEEIDLDLDNITYDREESTPLIMEEKPYMIKKIPYKIIDTIAEYYRLYANKGQEVKLNVWYNRTTDEFIIDCPFQRVTSVSVEEYVVDGQDIKWTEALQAKFPKKYEFNQKLNLASEGKKELELVLDTHSHHNMCISFSGVDDNNDYYKATERNLYLVFKNVIRDLKIDCRYFLPTGKMHSTKTSTTLYQDKVMFDINEILDFENEFTPNVSFEEFNKCVNISLAELYGIEQTYSKYGQMYDSMYGSYYDDYIEDEELTLDDFDGDEEIYKEYLASFGITEN